MSLLDVAATGAPVGVPATRRRLTVTGIVQGVGFRPFVYSLATELGLVGHVGNDAHGVFIEIEGAATQLDEFAVRLRREQPPLARIDDVLVDDVDRRGDASFAIVESTPADGPRTLVPPDVATCDDCLTELFDPLDRRYRYPFINCTNCGPRFTIIRDLPYDRPATTMVDFDLCPACTDEYTDPLDRRYHAQPVACHDCGPQLTFARPGVRVGGTDAVLAAVHRALDASQIVAVKGLGGYHLACDAADPLAVAELRRRKGRIDKPFAVMVPDLATARLVADVDAVAAEALTSAARPIVLLPRRPDAAIADGVAPANPLIGVMLAYTPLHHLLLAPVPDGDVEPPSALVMTSGNRSSEPICFRDDEALERLSDLADAFCLHDRPIELPCDDSVVRVVDGEVQPIRRARGYAPVPVALPFSAPPVLGVGGELKNTCCVASGRHAWVGQHIGDMENLATLDAFAASVDAFTTMYRVSPEVLGVDCHPGYLTRRWAIDNAAHLASAPIDVQHHHAHVASVMVEHGVGIDDDVFGIAFDGTGYGVGADGAPEIWGGEILRAGYRGFKRIAHLQPLLLPGGDETVRNPCRLALAYLTALGIPVEPGDPAVQACDDVERRIVPQQVERNIGCTPTTSMGRLFDVVSSLLDVRHRISYEAQAAIELEHLAEGGDPARAALQFDLVDQPGATLVIDPRPVLVGIVDGYRDGVGPADLAAAFHHAVADVVARLAARCAGELPIALTGGVFQNALLARLTRERLTGFEVLTHHLVPPNDGGLSLGQAAIAAATMLDRSCARVIDEGSM
ncbi:MAG: carbamoyltransferase HypF [Actinomycetota bacterium]